MKRIKLLFAAFAAMLALTAQAGADWTAPEIPAGVDPVSGGVYKIRNVEGNAYLHGGTAWFSWSTSAVLTADINSAFEWTITGDDSSGYTFACNRSGNNKLFTSGNENPEQCMHVDGGTATKYFIEKQASGYYRLRQDGVEGKFIGGPDGKNGVLAQVVPGTYGENCCEWEFIDIKAYSARLGLYNEYLKAVEEGVSTDDAATVYNNPGATIEDLNAATAALRQARRDVRASLATNDNPQDLTDLYVVNPDFSTLSGDGWTRTGSWGNQQFGTGAMESWNNNNVAVLQDLTDLPNGRFRVSCDMISGNDTKTAYVYAKGMTEVIGETVSAKSSAGNYNTMSNEVDGNTVSAYPVLVDNHTMTIGFKDPSGWVVVDNFKIIYYGPDLTAFKEALQSMIDDIADLEGTIPTAAYNAVKTYADGINVESLNTEEAIADASTELSSRIDAAKALQVNYARYNSIKNAAKAISNGFDATSADTAVEAATDNDGINTAIATLRAAFLAELPNVEIPADPGFIDVTAVMVDNAGVHTNTDYWTKGGTPNGGYSFGVCNYGECEFYNCNFKFYQTLALTPGTWEFGVTGFHRAGNHNTHFYAGDDRILIPGVANSVVNSMAEAKTYFDNGNGLVALKFLVETASDVEIGIDNQDTQTDKWTIFRDFTLKYFGAPDYTIYEEQWAALVVDANDAKTAHPAVTGTELTELNAAIADSPAGAKLKATYIAKIDALQAALTAFNAAAPSYDAYAAYKAETIALWATDFEVKAPTTAAEAVNAVAQLNVAQYNNVKDNYTYSLDGLIGDFGTWTGTATVAGEPDKPNYLDWEHWSGTQHAYYEQAADGWGNANGWTIKYEKTCKLPAGNYVLKVAARSSAGTTSKVSCSAIPTTISLPSAGNNTRGINTSGAASWSDDDTFANTGSYTDHPATQGGTGAGWQWRFLPFELDKDTEVTMTFEAEATTQYQWMSIGDAVLLSDDDPAEEVDYNDDEDNTIESALIANVTVNREIKADFNTVVLPFNVTAVQVAEIFGEGTKVYNFSENSENAETAEIKFQSGDGSITANVPVLVKATKASSAQEFKGVVVEEPASDIKVAGKFVDFVGTYAPVDVAEGDYFVGNGALYRSEGNTSMNAFRAFLKVKSAEVKAELFIDGVATAIESINGNGAQPAGAIYNLAGQRVQKAQRGLYIVNGKKIVVK